MGNAESMPAVTMLHGYIDRNGGCDMMMDVTEAECAWAHRWYTNWNVADLAYGQPMIILFCAVIAVFTAANGVHLLRQTHVGSILLANLPAYKFFASLARGFGGRQARVGGLRLLPSGTSLLVAGLAIFSAGLCLGPKPYYWPDSKFGSSPPIATRAGWMSIAILPFQVLLASKWNMITVLTGISHEKLQPLHRWTAWIMYVLALIHTFPFIVVDIQMGMMESSMRTFTYWSGVAALVPNTFLVTMSIAAIRNRYYETFKAFHFVVAAFFIVMLFLHCGFTQTSADYFIGFAAVYLFSLFVRWGKSFKHGFHHRASFEVLADRMLKITIPSHVAHAPGQHFFFRFLNTGVHSWTSHPFTVASVSASGQMEIFARVGRGITERLASIAGDKDASVPVLLDGPYGGVGGEVGIYDRVLLIGGGSGGSFVLALARHLATLDQHYPCKSVTVLFATRSIESLGWFKEAFEAILVNAGSHLDIDIHLHVTSAADPSATAKLALGPERKPSQFSSSSSIHSEGKEGARGTLHVSNGRPNVPAAIAAQFGRVGTLGVVACGPEEMTIEVRNSVAKGQLDIARGTSPATECFLHTEAFSW